MDNHGCGRLSSDISCLSSRKGERFRSRRTTGRGAFNGMSGRFVFRFGKVTNVSRIVFAPFQNAACNLRDVVVEGFADFLTPERNIPTFGISIATL
jgi:hypothetical protein